MTGFAFYSCNERFDNPVDQRQDPANPNAKWTYEVGIKFEQFYSGYYDVDGEYYTYKAPATVFVYNKEGEKLGELYALEDDNENFNWDSYHKYSGILQGSIGEELTISTIEGFDIYSKQDGTLKSILENSILQIAEVPIFLTNTTSGSIATKSVNLTCAVSTYRARLQGNFSDKSDKGFTFSGDSLAFITADENGVKSFNITFAESVEDPVNNGFFFTFASEAQKQVEYTFEINSENGYKSISTWNTEFNAHSNVWGTYWFYFNTIKELDLSKYTTFLKDVKELEEPYNISISTLQRAKFEPIIYQSSKDTVNAILNIRGKATIKNLIIGKQGKIYFNGYWDTYESNAPEYQEYNYLPVITLEGENVVETNEWQALNVNAETILKGDGTLKVASKSNAIHISSYWWREKNNNEQGWYSSEMVPARLTLTENVKLISNTRIFIGQVWNWNAGVNMPCTLEVASGTLEAKGAEEDVAINLYGGQLKIGTDATKVVAVSGQTGDNSLYIRNDMNNPYTEVKTADLVEDITKFNDIIDMNTKTRTITPKK